MYAPMRTTCADEVHLHFEDDTHAPAQFTFASPVLRIVKDGDIDGAGGRGLIRGPRARAQRRRATTGVKRGGGGDAPARAPSRNIRKAK